MHFSIAITLGLHYLLCQKVSSSKYSILDNHQSSIDQANNILREFFVEFAKVLYPHKDEYRHVTIIGASPDNLRHMQSILENYPYIICTNSEKCVNSQQSNSGNIFIIFRKDLGHKMVETPLEIVSPCSTNCRAVFVFEGTGIETKDFAPFTIHLRNHGISFPDIAYLNENGISFYRNVMGKSCGLTVSLSSVWKPGTKLSKINDLFSRKKLELNGCPITVGTIPSFQKMVTERKPDGSIAIVGGKEGNLVLLLAETLNFTVVTKYPSLSEHDNESLEEILIQDVASRKIDVAIARLRPINFEQRNVKSSKSFDTECVTWAVPRRIKDADDFMWKEFPGGVWAVIAAVFVIACVMQYAFQIVNFRGNRNRRKIGFIAGVLDVLAMSLGNASIFIPIRRSGKLLLMSYLFYAMIITTAYKTSLAAILATESTSSAITDVKGIIEANLKIGGSRYNFEMYMDQDNPAEYAAKVAERYEFIPENGELMDRLESDSEFACLARRSSLIWEKRKRVLARDLITFDTLQSCVSLYSTVIVVRSGSHLAKLIDEVLWRVVESGLLKHWDDANDKDDDIWKLRNARKVAAACITQKFGKIFISYFQCLLLCLLVFLVELLTAKFQSWKIRRIVPSS